MATAAAAELRANAHSIEPIPEQDKDSTGPQQMWIWLVGIVVVGAAYLILSRHGVAATVPGPGSRAHR